ncbi:CsgG/HfaB family protein [bacterium]|nr:CsgG/HfaB family protein [bacterium]
MKQILLLALAVICTFFSLTESAAEPRVLVLPFDPIMDSTYNILGEQVPILNYQSALQTMINTNLGKREEIRVIERARYEELIKVRPVKPSLWNDPELAAELGNELGADFVVIGNYGEFPSEIRVDARIAIPATGDVPPGYSFTANGHLWDDLPTLADRISAQIIEKILAEGNIRPVSKGILMPEGDLADFDLAGTTPANRARLTVWVDAPAPHVIADNGAIQFERCQRIDLMNVSPDKMKHEACRYAILPSGQVEVSITHRGYLPYREVLSLAEGKAYRLEVKMKVIETQLYR